MMASNDLKMTSNDFKTTSNEPVQYKKHKLRGAALIEIDENFLDEILHNINI